MSCSIHTEEKLVECPFDKNHRVRTTYLPYHIVRCMKNYPDYAACPYNASHRVKKCYLTDHMKSCPDKYIVMPSSIKDSHTLVHGNVSETPIHVGNSKWNTEDEDWSKDS